MYIDLYGLAYLYACILICLELITKLTPRSFVLVVYDLVLSLSIIVSLSLSAVARNDATNANCQKRWIVRQVCVPFKHLLK